MYLVSSHHNKFTIRALQVKCSSVSDVEALDQGGLRPPLGGGSAPPLPAATTRTQETLSECVVTRLVKTSEELVLSKCGGVDSSAVYDVHFSAQWLRGVSNFCEFFRFFPERS